MPERGEVAKTRARLTAFKEEWFKKHPENTEILEAFKPVIKAFVSHLTPDIGEVETDLDKMLVVWSSDPKSSGYLKNLAKRFGHAGGFVTAKPEYLEQVGLTRRGVFIQEHIETEADFGFAVFHEFTHHLIKTEAERTQLQIAPSYKYLEEGFASWMAVGALTAIGNEHGKRTLPFQAPVDEPQAIFSAFLDRLAKAAVPEGKTPRYKTYKKVIEKAIMPLMFSRDISYLSRLSQKAFGDEQLEQFFKLVKTASEQYKANADELSVTALRLYNLISGNNFKTWEPWNDMYTNKSIYKAVYWPPYTTMFD